MKVKPAMDEQEIRDAGLAVDVPFEAGDPKSPRLKYDDLGKKYPGPPAGWSPSGVVAVSVDDLGGDDDSGTPPPPQDGGTPKTPEPNPPTKPAPPADKPVATQEAAVDYTSGSMIAVYPTVEEASDIARPGGQPAATLHATLAFLPDGVPDDKVEQLQRDLERVAEVNPKLEGIISGVAKFQAGKDGPPVVGLVSVVGLDKLRVEVVTVLERHGIKVANNHGWVAHMTLGYGDVPDAEGAIEEPVTFEALSMVLGSDRFDFPLKAVEASSAFAREAEVAEEAERARVELEEAQRVREADWAREQSRPQEVHVHIPELPTPQVTVNVPEQAAPVVNVEPTPIHVNIEPAQVTVEAPAAAPVGEKEIVIKRDGDGKIVGGSVKHRVSEGDTK